MRVIFVAHLQLTSEISNIEWFLIFWSCFENTMSTSNVNSSNPILEPPHFSSRIIKLFPSYLGTLIILSDSLLTSKDFLDLRDLRSPSIPTKCQYYRRKKRDSHQPSCSPPLEMSRVSLHSSHSHRNKYTPKKSLVNIMLQIEFCIGSPAIWARGQGERKWVCKMYIDQGQGIVIDKFQLAIAMTTIRIPVS